MELLSSHSNLIHKSLDEVDRYAQQNVIDGHGGPFGARLGLFSLDAAGNLFPQVLFPVFGNMVLETGIASNHAEAQALASHQIAELKSKIRKISFGGHTTPVVILFSSAQPCMACHSKIEICARHLVHEGLIKPKHFILVYGANYDATEMVAGFHDYAYALDFFSYRNSDDSKYTLISHIEQPIDDTPADVQAILSDNALLEAVLVHQGRTIGLGYNQRTEHEYYKTSECVAIHAASRTLKKEGHAAPWNLDGATLYTLNTDIGPLSYAECQWANVMNIVSIAQPAVRPVCAPDPKYADCPNCTNEILFKRISEGYNTPWSMVRVFHDPHFQNIGQKEWSSRMDRVVYNGCNVGNELSKAEKQIFDNLFCPDPLP